MEAKPDDHITRHGLTMLWTCVSQVSVLPSDPQDAQGSGIRPPSSFLAVALVEPELVDLPAAAEVEDVVPLASVHNAAD